MPQRQRRAPAYHTPPPWRLGGLACLLTAPLLNAIALAQPLAQSARASRAGAPVSQATRLAVLEVQGALGSLEERQAWSDAMRAVAIERLEGLGVAVIDRAQFELLLPPSADLSECVGMCEAQVARAVGARWSLSARLAAQGGEGGIWTVTLKLHSLDGALLKVVQRASLPSVEVPAALSSLTAEALAPLAPLDPASRALGRSPQPAEVEPTPEPPPQPPPPSPEEEAAWSHRADGLHWVRVETPAGARCVSERVTATRYGVCVAEGRCGAPGRGGRCPAEGAPAWAPQTCVDAQQAVAFARAVGAYVASEPELRALYVSCPLCVRSAGAVWEWALTPAEQSDLSALPAPRLRAASKRLVVRSEGAGRRLLPPAFRVPDVSFRLARAVRGGGCSF